MKSLAGFVVWLFLSLEIAPAAERQADLSLHCLSVRLFGANLNMFGLRYRLEFGTDPNPNVPVNGEIALGSGQIPASHYSFYQLTLPEEFEPIQGAMYLNVPLGDSDGNGVPDFFETSKSVGNARTTGTFDDGAGGTGRATATWNRGLGAKDGTCRMQIVSQYYDLTFNHSFEILEFGGKFSYTASGTNRVGNATLTQAQGADSFAGPLTLGVASTNALVALSNTWTNAAGQQITVLDSGIIQRGGTNYSGLFVLQDGDLTSAIEDFDYWAIHLSDAGDADQDGIPDLSDALDPVAAPRLSVSLVNSQVLLRVEGTAGASYQLEKTGSLSPALWEASGRITLTNQTQNLLPIQPQGRAAFWRLKTE